MRKRAERVVAFVCGKYNDISDRCFYGTGPVGKIIRAVPVGQRKAVCNDGEFIFGLTGIFVNDDVFLESGIGQRIFVIGLIVIGIGDRIRIQPARSGNGGRGSGRRPGRDQAQ